MQLNLAQNRLVFLSNALHKLGATLRVLKLSGNSLTKMEGLEHLLALEYLDCSHNHISRIEKIDGCKRLSHLNLSFNAIASLSNLSSLGTLKVPSVLFSFLTDCIQVVVL